MPVNSASSASCSVADVQHRLVRGRDQLGGLPDLAAVRLGVRLVTGQFHPRRPAERALTLQHVLGDVDEHRAGTSRGCDVEGLGHDPGNLVAGADQEVVLGDRHRDARDVGLLEGIRPDQRAPDLPGDRDHGDGVHLGVGQRGHQVGGTGTRGGHADPDLPGRVRVSTGGVAGALLVPNQHVAQLFRVEQWVINRQHRTARNAEDELDVEFLQRPDHRLCAGKLLGPNTFRLARRGGRDVRGAIGRPDVWPGGCAHGVLVLLS
jgi:hypothetical protein